MNFPLKRRKREPMGTRLPARIDCPGHLKWLRGNCCAIEGRPGHACSGRMHAHHAREGANGGMGKKPDDTTAVPLCDIAHAEIHNVGWQTFERRHCVDLSAMAAEFARLSPHRTKWMNR